MTMPGAIAAARLGPALRNPDGSSVFEFRFGADNPVFAGHFPGHPLLPGVFQLEMARAAAEWVLDAALIVREVNRAKFQRPILPDEIVRLELKTSASGEAIQARAVFSIDGQPAGETTLSLCRKQP